MIAVIQARMGSTRLSGKVLAELGQQPVLAWVVKAAQDSDAFDTVVVATSTAAEDDPIEDLTVQLGADCVRGPELDVLARFVLAVEQHGARALARLTADCTLLDPSVMATAVAAFAAAGVDYLSTIEPRTLPRGLDVELLTADALRRADAEAAGADRSHVTSLIRRHPEQFPRAGLVFAPPAEDLRVTLDEPADLEALRAIVAELGPGARNWRDLVAFLRAHPDIARINAGVRQKAVSEG